MSEIASKLNAETENYLKPFFDQATGPSIEAQKMMETLINEHALDSNMSILQSYYEHGLAVAQAFNSCNSLPAPTCANKATCELMIERMEKEVPRGIHHAMRKVGLHLGFIRAPGWGDNN